MTPDWLRYQNQGAIRSKPIAGGLIDALSFLPEIGVTMEVFSGGQAPKGSGGPRTGSTRHDHGNAADVFFQKDGRRLDWANPDDVPIFQQIVQRGKANGVTGFGAGQGYMQPGSMHIGFGAPSVWGAGGKGSNAPDWLSEAYHGKPGHVHNPNQGVADAAMAALGKAPIGAGADTSTAVGGLSMSPSSPPDNLSQGAQMQPEQQPDQQRQNMFFKNMDPARRDRLIMALQGMTMNPNQGLMQMAQGNIQDRRDTAKEQQAQALEAKRKNQTAEWLARAYGPDAADAFVNGGNAGLKLWQAQSKAASDPNVQSSAMMPDQSGTVLTMRDGSLQVVTVGGERLTGQAAGDFVRRAQEQYTNDQRSIYGARTTGTNQANIATGGDAAEAVRRGTLTADAEMQPGITADVAAAGVTGKARGESQVAAPGNMAQAQQGIALIDSILNDPALPNITGMVQGRLPPMNQSGTDLNVKIEQLQGKAFLEAFESLKGGGAITEREGLAAQNAMARLQRAQSTQAYTEALQELRSIMEMGLARAQNGGQQAPAAVGPSDDDLLRKYGGN